MGRRRADVRAACRRWPTRSVWSSASSSPTPSRSTPRADELPGDRDVHVRPEPLPADHRDVQSHQPAVRAAKCASPSPAARKSSTATSCSRPGIWPITVATTILKPGGYNRLHQMVEKVESLPYRAFSGTDSAAISDLSAGQPHRPAPPQAHQAPARAQERGQGAPHRLLHRALQGRLPDPSGHPGVHRARAARGLYGPALKLITEKNPLPFHHRHDLRAPLPEQVHAQLLRRIRPHPRRQARRRRSTAMTR